MANLYHRKFYLDQQHHRMAPLASLHSASYSKATKVKNRSKPRISKPYYAVQTESEMLPKQGQLGRVKGRPNKDSYLAERLKHSQKIGSKKQKQKSSISKKGDSKKSKSKSKKSKSLQKCQGKSVTLNRRQGPNSREKSQQSRSTRRKMQPSTNQFSHQRFSKAFKVTYDRQKSHRSKKKQKSKGTPWQQVLEEYGEYLTVGEIAELKQIQTVYFLGAIKQRKTNQLFMVSKLAPLSDRKHHNVSELYDGIQPPFYNQLLSERKHDFEGDQQPLPEDDFYRYQIGDHVAYRYEIMSSINKGAFGEVLKVFDHKNRQYLALKIVKKCPELVPQTLVEISILSHVNDRDKEGVSGIVKIKDFTIFRRHICIIFQLLERNLFELVAANNYNGFDQDQVRLFAIQLLNSLNFMKNEKIIHCDLKPQNIVLQKEGKMGIKIIDFGTSCFEGKQMYEYLQSRYYRAPQIIMGTGYSYPIDTWSIGCILAQLRIGEPIFAGASDVEQLTYIANAIGLPSKADGPASQAFLQSAQMKELIENECISEYRKIKSEEELKQHPLFSQWRYIRNSMVPFQERIKNLSTKTSDKFIRFIQSLLQWEPDKRARPADVLEDPWITGGLPKEMKKIYVAINESIKQSKSKSKSRSKERRMNGSKNMSKPKSKSKSKSKEKGRSKTTQKRPLTSKQKSRSKSQQRHSSKERNKSINHKIPYQKYFQNKYSLEKDLLLRAKLKGVIR